MQIEPLASFVCQNNKKKISVAHPHGGYSSTDSRSNWNLECWFLWKEENRRTRRKTLGARTRTKNKLNPHMTPGPGIEPGTHWWEASALTTALSLLPQTAENSNNSYFPLINHPLSTVHTRLPGTTMLLRVSPLLPPPSLGLMGL